MKNDVDPMSMTLSEIYDIPDFYFERMTGDGYHHYNPFTGAFEYASYAYKGVVLRQHGTQFFNIKMDDSRDLVTGGHEHCVKCNTHTKNQTSIATYWKYQTRLGEYFKEYHPPNEYVRPHP